MKKYLIFPFLFFVVTVSAQAPDKAPTQAPTHAPVQVPQGSALDYAYEISFYTWKYHLGWKTDTLHFKDKAGNMRDTTRLNLKIADATPGQFKLEYPLKKSFDSARFVIKDMQGNELRVTSFEVFYKCAKCEMLSMRNFSGLLHNAVASILNTSKPEDQIIIRNIQIFDDKQKKPIQIPDLVITH